MKGVIVANRYRDTYLVGNSIDIIVEVGDEVVIKTPDGYDFGVIKYMDVELLNEKAIEGYEIERKANEKDLIASAEIAELAKDVESVFERFVEENLLNMSYVDSFFKFDRSKIVFFFTSAERVDFRQLVRDLATEYKSRIELRQVGVRDKSKIIGGFGMCGCNLCCNAFLKEFTTIDTNMAKVQDLIINPEKISGVCGRLMCCLAYEKDFYIKEKRCYPGAGSYYTTDRGRGYVKSMNILTGIMLLQHEDGTYEEVKVEKSCGKFGKNKQQQSKEVTSTSTDVVDNELDKVERDDSQRENSQKDNSQRGERGPRNRNNQGKQPQDRATGDKNSGENKNQNRPNQERSNQDRQSQDKVTGDNSAQNNKNQRNQTDGKYRKDNRNQNNRSKKPNQDGVACDKVNGSEQKKAPNVNPNQAGKDNQNSRDKQAVNPNQNANPNANKNKNRNNKNRNRNNQNKQQGGENTPQAPKPSSDNSNNKNEQ